jgi:hypothetical protein
LGIVQETPGFVTCDNLLDKVWIIICCFDELITGLDGVTALFLHQYSWHNMQDSLLRFTTTSFVHHTPSKESAGTVTDFPNQWQN